MHRVDEHTAALATSIGVRVRQERTRRRWTLDDLAAAAGVSRRMLVNVEQGTSNPSVGTLLRLSSALGVGLPSLVELTHPAPLDVTRAGEGALLWSGEHGGRGVLMAAGGAPRVLELWEWSLAPGDRHDSEAHSAGAEELLHVHEGCVTIEVSGQTVELEAGDALAFRADVPHTYRNESRAPASFSLAVFEPDVTPGGRPPRPGPA